MALLERDTSPRYERSLSSAPANAVSCSGGIASEFPVFRRDCSSGVAELFS